MNSRILGGLSAGLIALLLAGCSSSSSSPPTTTTTSTTLPATAVSGAGSPRDLGVQYADALKMGAAKFCTTYALPSQVSECSGDLSQLTGASLKGFKVGAVAVQGDQAVISFTGTACAGSQCVSNSDPNGATDPESAVYVGSSFAELFAAANNPNSQSNSPFIGAGVQQGGRWYASGF
jgi:hypothetical protein